MSHYCTYFDRAYLAQGLALWRSLQRHDSCAELWVLALDDTVPAVLRRLGGDRLHIVELQELKSADAELAGVEQGRPRMEFIFALTPCFVRHVLRTCGGVSTVMYLDADLFFFSRPKPIWDCLAAYSVLIVSHRFPPWHDDSHLYGRFNVGVLGFRNDPYAHACLDWWRERCLDSTATASGQSAYGDQKYLDEWPERFSRVIEMQHAGVNLAPWNWAAHRFSFSREQILVDGVPLVVFHFAQFRRVRGRWFDSGQLEYGIMPLRLRSRIYEAYWQALVAAEREIRVEMPGFSIGTRGWKLALGALHLAALRLAWGQFWLRIGRWWIAGRLGLGVWSSHFLAIYRKWQKRTP